MAPVSALWGVARQHQLKLAAGGFLAAIAGATLLGAFVMAFILRPELVKSRLGISPVESQISGDVAKVQWSSVATNLFSLERASIPLGGLDGSATGGAIEAIGNQVIHVTASGLFAFVDIEQGRIDYQSLRVPMNYESIRNDVFSKHPRFNQNWYRVMDLLLLPDSVDRWRLLVSHHEFMPDTEEMCVSVHETPIIMRDGVLVFPDDDWDLVYRIDSCFPLPEFDWSFGGHLSGGRMLAFDDNHILLTVGDFGLPDFHDVFDRVGQFSDNDLGKLLKINLEDGSREIYAKGIRNAQGLAFDAQGRLWETEHAARGGDEVNLIEPGGQYGWPVVSLGMRYNGDMPLNPVQGEHKGFDLPVYSFVPSIGISNILSVPDHPAWSLWKDDMLVLSLVGETIFRLRIREDRVIYSEPIVLGERLRDGVYTADGVIAILTGDRNLLLLRPTEARAENQIVAEVRGYEDVVALREEVLGRIVRYSWGQDIYRGACARCHSLEGKWQAGPPLNGIVNAPIANEEDFPYSDALAAASGGWTRKRLTDFINNPEAAFPGSNMSPSGLGEYKVRALIDYLAETER